MKGNESKRGRYGSLGARALVVACCLIWVYVVALAGCGGRDETASPEGEGEDAAIDSGGAAGEGAEADAAADAGEGGDAGEITVDCDYSGPPLIDVELYDQCSLCDNARCVPPALIDPEYTENLADCEDRRSKCVPEIYLENAGIFWLETCRSLKDAEGRCLSLCIPDVASQEERLPRDTCAADERCVPCYDPFTGEETGACGISCDEGPEEEAVVFDECCGGAGSCVPESVVDDEFADQLGAEGCEQGELCSPDAFNDPEGFTLQRCESAGGGEGRCVPDCVPLVADNADVLVQDVCPDGQLCAPCYDPLSGEETGACDLSKDSGPVEPPFTFAECCGGLAVCVPAEIVPEDQVDLLGRDSCAGEDELCVPRVMADPEAGAPQSCQGWNGAEGRCLPKCLPDVAKQGDHLLEADCAEGYVCVPCFDPVDGEETGACSTPNDSGPADDPYGFPECCGGLSVCLPAELISAEDRELLDRGECAEPDTLCVPKEMTEDDYVPETCSSWNGSEGRCLPDCLPLVAADADYLNQDICDEGYLCSPCYDGVTGEQTPACTIGADPGPEDPPYLFPECCGGLSVCVPAESIPVEDRASLGRDSCLRQDDLCVPKSAAEDPEGYVPEFCRSWGNAEGRCLPACLPDVAEDADRLSRVHCDEGYLCVPCFDQITGEETGACSVAGDPGPSEPGVLFQKCCDDLAVCVPGVSVPSDDRDGVGRDSCSDEDDLCVPIGAALDPSGFVAPSCHSWNDAEGRCLPACLPDIADNADRLSQDVCEDNYLCAPCYDQITGELQKTCFAAGDTGPKQPPVIFQKCCDERSVCVEPAAVPDEDDREGLGSDSCTDETMLCVPIPMAEEPTSYVAQTCTAWGDVAEGRCVYDCLPDVEEQEAFLTPGIVSCPEDTNIPCTTCPEGHLCAPCYDPLTGELTPACTAAGDPGPETPPGEAYTFAKCCPVNDTTLGTCIPRALAGTLGESLPTTGCPPDEGAHPDQANDFVCTPDVKIEDPAYQFENCITASIITTLNGLNGACISECFLEGLVAMLLQPGENCESPDLCVPCNDPLNDNAPTGACE